jgi:hypothetical protein
MRNVAAENIAPRVTLPMNALRGKCMEPPSELRGG